MAKRLRRRPAKSQPYVNIASSLIIAGLLVLLAYAVTRPLMLVSAAAHARRPAAGDGADLCRLLRLLTRKKALTQIVGFLVLENGIALLAALGTFGIPLIVEMGVFLDVLMGFLVHAGAGLPYSRHLRIDGRGPVEPTQILRNCRYDLLIPLVFPSLLAALLAFLHRGRIGAGWAG